jgi:hypothetical protein
VSKSGIAEIGPQTSTLARLAVVYRDELRMKVVTEAYMRELSPKLFYEEFGGGSVSRVARHFERLVESDWLTLTRTETGGARRGAVEHFYRSTELVIFEEETWAALPVSMRAAFSWMTFEQLAERVRAAIVAGTFNACSDRPLGWAPLLLDRAGWKRVLEAADVAFRTILEEQDRAKRRFAESGETPFLSTAALAVFESPMWLQREGDWRNRPYAPAQEAGTKGAIDRAVFFPMLAKVCADPLDLQIVEELNRREMSAKQFHAELDGDTVSGFSRRLQKLTRQGWVKQVRQETGGKRRGATEHFYRATGPALIDNGSWAEVPDPAKATLTGRTFEQLRNRVKEAIDVGTFDANTDRHLTWSLLLLDEVGWKGVVGIIDAFFKGVLKEERDAKQRLAKSGEEPILTTVGLAAFESPKDSVRAP